MTLAYQSPTRSRSILSLLVCWCAIAGFVGFTAWSQWNNARRSALVAATSQNLPNLGLEITGRLAVAQAQLQARALANDHSPQAQLNADNLRKQLQQNIQILAVSPLDKLLTDADLLRTLYTQGPTSVTTGSHDKLIKDLGWFGELAVTQGQPENNSDRAAIMHAAHHSLVTMMGAVGVMIGAGFLGFLLLIGLMVLFALNKLRFKFQPVPREQQPVFLETFALWGIGYLLLSLSLRRWKSEKYLLVFEMLFLAGSLLIALWPLVRGLTWAQLREALGWHLGSGLLTEMGAGAIGYIAGLPLLAIGAITTLILARFAHVNPTHPIQQEFAGELPAAKIFALLLAISFAAPLLEETMFRGALYGHLRRRWRPWLSAGIVSLIFAAIHPQGWAGIPLLGAIAMMLATLREWRGSLIASITAHGINNAVALLFVVFVLK